MDQMNPLNSGSEEQNWLESRSEPLAAAGRAHQRTQAERFEHRKREDAATWRLLQFAALVIVLCLFIMLVVFAPLFWDAFTHYLHRGAPALLSVVAAPRLAPLTNIVRCRYCMGDIPVVGPPQPVSQSLIATYSEGCLCRLRTSVLKGLLAGNALAIGTYEVFKRRWYDRLDVPGQRAEEYCQLVCRNPLPDSFAALVAAELQRRLDVVADAAEDRNGG